jgi:hypothetical protein
VPSRKPSVLTSPWTSNVAAGALVPMPNRPDVMTWFPLKALPPARRATFELSRASGTEPLARAEAFNEVNPAPLPEKLLPALLKVTGCE